MFANRNATVMIPASDLERAKAWYRDKLGIEPTRMMGDGDEQWGASYEFGGGLKAFLYRTQFAGTAQATLLTFDSDDLLADMEALRSRGVQFEDYDLPDLKTVNGVADFGEGKNAWMRDSEGNILAIVEGM